MSTLSNSTCFYERLQTLCKREGVSVTHLTTGILGLSSGIATQWKNGVVPSASVIVSVSEYFHVSADYLLGLSDNPKRVEDYDTDSLRYLSDYLMDQLRKGNLESEVFICNLYKNYLEVHLQKLGSDTGISIDDVFQCSCTKKLSHEKAKSNMQRIGEALLTNINE